MARSTPELRRHYVRKRARYAMCVRARQGLWLDFVQCHANIEAIVDLREISTVLERFRLELRGHKQRALLAAFAAPCAFVATAVDETYVIM